MSRERGRPAVFLDRDGVLNVDGPAYIGTPAGLVLLPGAAAAVARLYQLGFAVVVITNQSGVGRGFFTEEQLGAVHSALLAHIEAAGGRIDALYHCPHLPDAGCICRKPSPWMVQRAVLEHGLDPSRSFFVGDQPGDIACGAAAGCRTILVLTGKHAIYLPEQFPVAPDHICADLPAAVRWIESTLRR